MTGEELVEIIQNNHLEQSEIIDGNLTFSDNDNVVIVYPIQFSNYSMWADLPFLNQHEWYENYLVNGPRKPFSTVERVPKEIYTFVNSVLDSSGY